MSTFAHSHLFLGPSTSTVVSGPYIQVLDNNTGAIITSTKTDDSKTPSLVLCAAVDDQHNFVVSISDEKKLCVHSLPDLKVLSERDVPKKPTSITITKDTSTILTADKFGDVHQYSLHPKLQETVVVPVLNMDDTENDAPSTLVLGHTSLLTSLLLSPDEKFVITADRDEHIRVSWFPEGYVIERYCLGHQKYVSAIHIPPTSPEYLISGGGDPILKIWEWKSGKLLADLPVLDIVKEYITVIPNTTKKPILRKDGKPQGRQRRKNAMAQVQAASQSADGAIPESTLEATDAPSTLETNGMPSEPTLVIQRISSLQVVPGNTQMIFSVVGATGIFYTPLSVRDFHPIQVIPMGAPVLNFSVTSDARLWVLLDADRGPEHSIHVKKLRWDAGQFVEDTNSSPLISTLNSTALIEATVDELSQIDHYYTLTSLPKRGESDNIETANDQTGEVDDTVAHPVGQSRARGKPTRMRQQDGPTVREEARKKLRERISEKMKAQNVNQDQDSMRSSTVSEDAPNEPPEKKTKVLGEDETL